MTIYLVLGGPSIVIDTISTEDTCIFIGENYQQHIDERAKFSCTKQIKQSSTPVGGKLVVRAKIGDTTQRPEPTHCSAAVGSTL